MFYRIIVYRWNENTPSAVIDLNVKENAWFLYHRYFEIAVQQSENINLMELYEMNTEKNTSVQLSACSF